VREESGAAVRVAPGVVFQEVEGETVLLDTAGDRYYALDEVGTRCWQLLVEHGEMDAVVAVMLREFDVDEETLRSDVAALFSCLTAAGLVVAVSRGE
jgi:Coenzyme PQQ synthesis protein D (PqqD)